MTQSVSTVKRHKLWRSGPTLQSGVFEDMARGKQNASNEKNPLWVAQGARLAETRRALEYPSVKALAEALAPYISVGESAIRNYESGQREIDMAFATALCDRLGLTLDWIYRGNPAGLPMALYQRLHTKRIQQA